MSNQNCPNENKFDVQLIFDSDNSKSKNNDDSELTKEIELSLKRDHAENERLPKEIIINGMKFTNISVRDVKVNLSDPDNTLPKENEPSNQPNNQTSQQNQHQDDNIMQIAEQLLQDQSDNKKIPEKAVIDDHELTNNHDQDTPNKSDKDQKIEEKQTPIIPSSTFSVKPPKKITKEPKYEPTIDEINSIRKRVRKCKRQIKLTVTLNDIGMSNFEQPISTNENELPRLKNVRNISSINQSHDESKEKEELPKMKNKKNAVLIQRKDEKTQTQPIKKPNDKNKPVKKKFERKSRYDQSLFYCPMCPEQPVRAPRQFDDPIVLNVTLKDIGMASFGSPINKRKNRVTYVE